MAKKATITTARTPETKKEAQEEIAQVLAIKTQLSQNFFNEKTDRYNQLLDRHQGQSSDQVTREEAPAPRGEQVTRVEEQHEEEVETPEPEQLITRTINGKQVSKTLDQWLEIASKVENADEYIANASRMLTSVTAKPQEVVVPQEITLDDVKNIQLGDQEEALTSINKIVKTAVESASNKIKNQTEKSEAELLSKRVLAEYAPLSNDPMMYQLSVQLMDQSIKNNEIFDAQNRIKDFELRIRSVWDKIKVYNTSRQEISELNIKANNKKNLSQGSSTTRTNPSEQPQVLSEFEQKRLAISQMRSDRQRVRN